MSLTIFAIAAVISQTQRPNTQSVRATVLLLRAEGVSAETWKENPRKSVRIIVDRDGRRVLLRTIEHE
jgi:hypothetical protein